MKDDNQGDDRLNWRYQDKAYNESFKKWRREKQDSVGFWYVEKPERLTYRDGVGFINDYPEAREAKAFRKVLTALGLILVYRVIVDIFFSFFLPPIMEHLGLNIHFSFFSGQRTGDRGIMMAIDIGAQILGRVIPVAILAKHLEFPFSVMIPTKITNKSMFRFSVPAVLLTVSVCTILSFFYNRVLALFHIETERPFIASLSTEGILYIVVVHVLIVPIISELCTHGVIMQAVRQFGDGAALCFTSVIIAAATYDVGRFMFWAVISFVTGYFIIRTGSVITGIVMRIVTVAYAYAVRFLYSIDGYGDILLRAFLFVTVMIGLVSAVRFLYKNSDKFTMSIKPGYMSFGRKILEIATNVPCVIWITLTFLVTAANIKFTI